MADNLHVRCRELAWLANRSSRCDRVRSAVAARAKEAPLWRTTSTYGVVSSLGLPTVALAVTQSGPPSRLERRKRHYGGQPPRTVS